jgi:hypothetical protein
MVARVAISNVVIGERSITWARRSNTVEGSEAMAVRVHSNEGLKTLYTGLVLLNSLYKTETVEVSAKDGTAPTNTPFINGVRLNLPTT